MKLTNTKLIALIFSLLIAFTSCNKDDSIFEEKIENQETDNNENQNPDNNQGNNQDSNDGITLYKISGENLVKIKDYKVTGKELEYQKDTKKHQEIWALVKKIVPLDYRNKINEFVLYSGEKDGSAGYVTPSSNDLSTWTMGIAIDFAFEGGFNANGELAYTIIHEFGHVLTLDKTQVNSSISANDCGTFHTGEGCSKEDSFINQSYQKYWKDIWQEFQSSAENETKQEAFYNKHSKRFVTRYASTNPGEDSAEVFAVFVTKKDAPTGNTIADKKIKLMYTYDELVTLRNYIRGNVSSNKGQSKSVRSFLPEAGNWKQANTFGKAHNIHCKH